MIRKLTLALALAALVPFPMQALAAPKPAAKAGAADAEAAAPAPLEGGAKAEDGGKTAVTPPDTYTVRAGDTLWDLSGRFLNNPWYWPKIWSYNPDITNPHWIYPGNTLKFFPSGEEGAVEVVPVEEDQPVAEEEAPEPVHELESLSRADMKQAASEDEKEAVSVMAGRQIGYIQQRTLFARHDAFVTPRELDESGVISASFEEKNMLSARDTAYVTFKNPGNVKVGETYAIYRTLREVKHPVSLETIGFQTTILGAGKVVALDAKAATVAIASSYDVIERGDRLGPYAEKPYRSVPPKANGKHLRGYIIGSPVEQSSELAQTQVVFIDKGKADGVEEGNTFTVVRSGEPLSAGKLKVRTWDSTLPLEDVGALLVLDVRDHTSAAMVTKSLRELSPGDRIEMRVAEAK